jgi:hypothetical protein
VSFDPLIWSNNLSVKKIRIVEGCNGNNIEGIYQFDKGIETANIDKLLNGENDYVSEFVNSPVSLVGDWVVDSNSETGCGFKPDETIEIGLTIICQN